MLFCSTSVDFSLNFIPFLKFLSDAVVPYGTSNENFNRLISNKSPKVYSTKTAEQIARKMYFYRLNSDNNFHLSPQKSLILARLYYYVL